MMLLKQSTAVTVKLGPFVDSTDGDTDETGLTIQKADVRLSKNGGNMASASADQGVSDAGAPHDEIGYYDISLDATDTGTLGRLKVMIHKSGGLHVKEDFVVVPANVYDSLVGGSDALQVHTNEITDGLLTAAKFASNAFTADKIADGALTAAKFASGAFDAVWSVTARSLTTFGTLVSDVATAVWGVATSALTSAGTIGKLLVDNINATISSRAAPGAQMDLVDAPNATAVTAIATATEAAILDEGDATALLAAIAAKVEEFLINDGDASATLAAIATAIRTELATELGRIDAAISTRLASGSYTAPLDAAGMRNAIGMAAANLDTQLGDLPTNSELAAALDALNDPTAAAIATAVMASAVDGSVDVTAALKFILALAAGKVTVSGSDPKVLVYRNQADSADVMTSSVDSGGNRTVS